ncbi:hypothetical protein OG883_41140 [Streptomyces sp. NBC_01142]|uniref:DUF6197 family protein n=1 Tax=Streptomyces sp. NBC_01142 TaxID=2975865 RepID=UPI002255EBFA|nr:hypothetical protein [Streptomyces sp. NBC_01142]MCX4826078.1 hypothetical protein [Streptomyces sp. NBC_01142]
MPASATMTAPRTFWSEAALAAAVDAAFAEALAEELAAPASDRPAIGLPDTETLIRQAGIATGPCPRDPREPSGRGQLLKKASVFTLRAAWWLLKHTSLFAIAAPVEVIRLWRFATPSTPASHEPVPQPAPRTGRAVTPADFLQATSDHIKTRGWTQHLLKSQRGVCMLGAQRSLIRGGTCTRTTAAEANTHLLAVTGARSVPRWNDRLTRTEAQVHDALLAAAARARAAR